MTRVVNFFGGPGVGKSTLAAGVFWDLKVNGVSAELVTEYAKDVTWEGRGNLLNDQLYLLAKQNRRLSRLLDHPVEFAITDSPLLLCAAYARLMSYEHSSLIPLVLEMFNSYDNINFVIKRNPEYYEAVGRSQTLSEAQHIDNLVIAMLDEYNIDYYTINLDSDPRDNISVVSHAIMHIA